MHKGHLSATDAGFLYVETPEMPMHIGSLYLLKPPAHGSENYAEEYRDMIKARAHTAPLFTHKLNNMPFELANPVWIEDDDVDYDYHIRQVTLTKPGTMDQLEKLVGRLHSSLLDRSRPLWEFFVIDGLQNGDLAFYSKVHHAALDGQAGMKLTMALLDATEEPREVGAPPPRPRSRQYQLGIGELLWSATTNALSQYVKLARVAPKVVKSAIDTYRATDADGKWGFEKFKGAFGLAPRTHINVTITNQRAFAAKSLPIAEVKAVGKTVGATVNDMVLALCSGALLRYLKDYDEVPKKSMIAAVPMSMRAEGDSSQNNQVTMLPVSLHSDIKHPLERLTAIRKSSNRMKDLGSKMKGLGAIDAPSIGTPWLMTGIVALYGRSNLASNIPPIANVAISNVPGPNYPLYMTRAMLRSMYPVSIPTHGIGCNITVQSYNGNLDFGITACRRAMPDVKKLATYLGDALDELKAAAAKAATEKPAEPAAATAPPPKRRKTKASAQLHS
ncbi:Putative diacylglycerol O-acyltransferase [Alphaproteobacteria bacterium SO-S41]|nr:Putative diacylglycerol O-acyltransferase [Alphaproteobacteria bacterium SO-S41]